MKQIGGVTFFRDAADFREWLAEHHDSAPELWMGLVKKAARLAGHEFQLTWEDAVVEALCYGWIDSVVHRIDEVAVRQRWTPRRATSAWSTVNIGLVEELIAKGRMQPAGLAAYALRKPERSGIYAYEQPAVQWGPEQEAAIAAVPAAAAFWAEATQGYQRTARSWVVSAKQEATRERRLTQLVADCAAGQLIPTQRYGEMPAWLARAAAAAKAAS